MPGAALLYMKIAYTDARGRPGHDFVEFHAGPAVRSKRRETLTAYINSAILNVPVYPE
jgi:hypothetical protein